MTDSKKLRDREEKIAAYESRDMMVVKSNALTQKCKMNLTLAEQKMVNYLISLIKPQKDIADKQPLEYEFEIKDYCNTCGIDNSGQMYNEIKDTLKALRDKSTWVEMPDGSEVTISWINKARTNKRSGHAVIRFDDDLAPYIFELVNNRTQYQLLNTLPMKSKYSLRMYELCHSWWKIGSKTYKLEELKKLLGVRENEYVNFKDFRRYVLEKSQEEINEFTDLNVYFEPITKGRKVVQIRLHIKEKAIKEKQMVVLEDNDILDGTSYAEILK